MQTEHNIQQGNSMKKAIISALVSFGLLTALHVLPVY